jgi:hypothetical protein
MQPIYIGFVIEELWEYDYLKNTPYYIMFRKHSAQQIDLSGDLSEFNYISKLEPASSSFYLAIGIALFESLIRLKSCPELTHNTWVSLFESISKTKKTAKLLLLLEKHQEFKRIAEKINNSDRSEASKLIKKQLSSSASLLSIDYGMRFVLHLTSTSDIEFILNNSFQDYLSLCRELPNLLNVGLGLGRGNQLKHFTSKESSPMLFVYQLKKDQFCLLYHKACKYIDEKQALNYTDCSVYPFTSKGLHFKRIPKQNQTSLKTNSGEIIELIKILSENLKNNLKKPTKSKILNKVQIVSKVFPQLSEMSVFSAMSQNEKLDKTCEELMKVKSPGFGSSFAGKTDFYQTSLIRNKTFSTGARRQKQNESLEYYSRICRNNMELYKVCRNCKKVVNCSDFSLMDNKFHKKCFG